jgi:hypothetical protein
MINLYRWPSKDASYHVSIHLAKWFQRRRLFRNQPIRNKNCFWRPCLLTNRNLMSNLYKVPDNDASYHVLVHLEKRPQRRFFRNQPIRNKNCLCGHAWERIGTKWAIVIKGLPRILPTKFPSIWPSGFRGDDFLEIDQSETIIAFSTHVF